MTLNIEPGAVCVVTGGASGIGYAIVRRLAELGATVVAADIQEDALEAMRRDLAAEGLAVQPARLDVRDDSAVEAFAEEVFDRYGRVDVMVSNAGVADISRVRPWEASPSRWRWIYDVNVFGLANCLHSFARRMVNQQSPSAFVATASELGLLTDLDSVIYGSSKHAVIRVMEGLHLHLEDIGSPMRATVLCPGLTATNIAFSDRNNPDPMDRSLVDPSVVAAVADSIAASADPSDVATALTDAIAEGRFYCITAPGIETAIRQRMTDQIEGRNPTLRPAGVYCGICAEVRIDCERCGTTGTVVD